MNTRAALSTNDAAFLIRLHSTQLRDKYTTPELGDIIWDGLAYPADAEQPVTMVKDDIREYHITKLTQGGDARYHISTRLISAREGYRPPWRMLPPK